MPGEIITNILKCKKLVVRCEKNKKSRPHQTTQVTFLSNWKHLHEGYLVRIYEMILH